jgi:hypothetical protein
VRTCPIYVMRKLPPLPLYLSGVENLHYILRKHLPLPLYFSGGENLHYILRKLPPVVQYFCHPLLLTCSPSSEPLSHPDFVKTSGEYCTYIMMKIHFLFYFKTNTKEDIHVYKNFWFFYSAHYLRLSLSFCQILQDFGLSIRNPDLLKFWGHLLRGGAVFKSAWMLYTLKIIYLTSHERQFMWMLLLVLWSGGGVVDTHGLTIFRQGGELSYLDSLSCKPTGFPGPARQGAIFCCIYLSQGVRLSILCTRQGIRSHTICIYTTWTPAPCKGGVNSSVLMNIHLDEKLGIQFECTVKYFLSKSVLKIANDYVI